jgi:GNAT superfamily N-acetyltransferase
MPFELKEVTDDKDFNEILPLLYAAFSEPYNSLLKWFVPIHTTFGEAIEDFKGRIMRSWKASPQLHWIKVTDTDTGKIIGAAEWEVRDTVEKPQGLTPPVNPYWHLESSEEKEFASRLFTGMKGFMKDRITRPHVGKVYRSTQPVLCLWSHTELEQIVVSTEYRRKGVGRMLIDWGLRKADEMGLETCIQSVPSSVPAYEATGFANLDCWTPDMNVPNPSEKWSKWQADDLRTFLMWRPAGRNFRQGEDKAPWLDK